MPTLTAPLGFLQPLGIQASGWAAIIEPGTVVPDGTYLQDWYVGTDILVSNPPSPPFNKGGDGGIYQIPSWLIHASRRHSDRSTYGAFLASGAGYEPPAYRRQAGEPRFSLSDDRQLSDSAPSIPLDGTSMGLVMVSRAVGQQVSAINEINWPVTPDINNPESVARFVSELNGILDPYIARHEGSYVLMFLESNEASRGMERSFRNDRENLKAEIIKRYGKFLTSVLELATRDVKYSQQVMARRPYILSEIREMLHQTEIERLDQDVRNSLKEIEEKIIHAYAEARKEAAKRVNEALQEASMPATKPMAGRQEERIAALGIAAEYKGCPLPELFGQIPDESLREEIYRLMMGPYIEAYEKIIIPARKRESGKLVLAGINETANELRLKDQSDMTWSQLESYTRAFIAKTEARYKKFLERAGETFGKTPAELKLIDFERAVSVMIERASGSSGIPTITQEEAIGAVRRFCIDMAGIDIDDPKYGLIAELRASSSHCPSKGVAASGVFGGKLVLAELPEHVTLDGLRTVLHEVAGHLVHYVLKEDHLRRHGSGYLLASNHPRALSEAFANAMESMVYDEAWAQRYLPAGGFSQEYIRAYAEVIQDYEVYRMRRALFLAHAAHAISDISLQDADKIRHEIGSGIMDILEVLDNPMDTNYPFAIPHLANGFDAYLPNYVRAYDLANAMRRKAAMAGATVFEAFKPMLELGGAQTNGQMYEILLGDSLSVIFSEEMARARFEDATGMAVRELPVVLRSGDVFTFTEMLRLYFNQMATVLSLNFEGVLTDVGALEKYGGDLIRIGHFVRAVEANPWLKEEMDNSIRTDGLLFTDVYEKMRAKLESYWAFWVDSAECFISQKLDEVDKAREALHARASSGEVKGEAFKNAYIELAKEAKKVSDDLSKLSFYLGARAGDDRVERLRRRIHNSNNVLGGIIGYADLMRRGHWSHMEEIIRATLRPARDVKAIIHSGYDINCLTAERNGVQIIVPVEDDIPEAVREVRFNKSVAGALDEIVINLVSNAIKYLNEGVPAGERRVELAVRFEGGNLVIICMDNGRGMSSEDVGRYGSGERGANVGNAKGQGIGSRYVKETVASFGGTVDINSEVGRGTIVTVSIPLARLLRSADGSVTLSMFGLQGVVEVLERGVRFLLRRGGGGVEPVGVSIIPFSPPLEKGGKGGFEEGETDVSVPADMLIEEVSKGLAAASEIISKKPYKAAWDEIESLEVESLTGGLSLYFEESSGEELQKRMRRLFRSSGLTLSKFVATMQAVLAEADLNLWIHLVEKRVGIVVEPQDVAKLKAEYTVTAASPTRRQTLPGVVGRTLPITPDAFIDADQEVGEGLRPLPTGTVPDREGTEPRPYDDKDELDFSDIEGEGNSEVAFIMPPADTVVKRLIHPPTEKDLRVGMADTAVISPHGSPAGVQTNAEMSVSDIVDKLIAMSLKPTEFRQAFLALYDEDQLLYSLVLRALLKRRDLSKLIRKIISEVDIQIASRED